VGQAVSAGDLLVTGDWTNSYGVRRLTRCMASVKAKTRRTHTVKVPFTEIQRRKNGKNRKFFAISLGKLRIPLYFKKKIDYNIYDTVFWERMLTVGDLALPIGLSCQIVYGIQEVPITRTEASVKEMAYTRLGFYEEDSLAEVRILNRTLNETVSKQAFVLDAVYECEEEIGIPLPIKGVTDAENTEKSSDKFPKRNRIIAGLSEGVLIIEASAKSGSSITARWANKYGKKVFAIPGRINDKMSEGTIKLIKEYAILTTNIDEIISNYPQFANKKRKTKNKTTNIKTKNLKENERYIKKDETKTMNYTDDKSGTIRLNKISKVMNYVYIVLVILFFCSVGIVILFYRYIDNFEYKKRKNNK
jgi:hypothetical protein